MGEESFWSARHVAEYSNLKEDQVLIVDLGPDEDSARRSAAVLGQVLPFESERMVVI